MSWCRFLLMVMLAGGLGPLARAAEPAPVEGVVTRVVIEGNRRIEEAVVLAAVGIRRGEQANAVRIRRDLEAVFKTGFFEDVVMELRPDPSGEGVQLVVRVTEKPAVRDVKLVGHKKVEEDDLREVLDVRAFTVLNEAKVKENVQKLRDVYVDKGYFLVDIEPAYAPVGNDQVDVVFNIVENRKVVVQRVEFAGNDHLASGKIKRYLQVKSGGILPFLGKAGTFKRDLLEADQRTVSAVFLEEGYLDVQVEPPKVYLSPDKRFIFIHYDVTEGDLYSIGSVGVEGDFVEEEGLTKEAALQVVAGRQVADIQEDQWRLAEDRGKRWFRFETKGARLQTGEEFRYSTMDGVRANIEALWKDQGYAFVNVVPDIQPNPETRIADITYEVDRGEKVRIGRINITGNDPTLDKVIRREIPINEGEVFRGSLLGASRQRLLRLGFFEDVTIATPPGEGKNVLDLNVQAAERPTGSFSLGLGYSSLERLVLNGSVSKANFLGMGYNMSASANWSRLRRQGSVSFQDPFFLDTRWIFSFDAYYLSQQFQVQNDEYRRGGSLSFGRYLDARNDINVRLQYTFEDVGLQNVDPFRLQLYGGDLYRNGITSSLGAVFSIDKRNDRIRATRGWLANASTTLAGGFRLGDDRLLSLFGGEFNFVESKANFRLYQPLLPKTDRLVFQMNSTLGDIRSTDGREVAFIQRYRVGGINSLRGFNWFSLGPSVRVAASDDPIRADDKLIVGGTQSWTNNFEVEFQLVPQAGISVVGFFDAGNGFGGPRGIDPLSPFALRTSFGGGVRWQSPIGPLRFELGIPLRPQPDERKSVFDFGIGRFF